MAECVQCGYCCRIAPCPFGIWDPDKEQCSFLLEDNHCQKYYEIKERPGANISPAFGAGCSSSLGNTERQKILAARHGTPEEFAESCYKAVPGFISVDEAHNAIIKYEREYNGRST